MTQPAANPSISADRMGWADPAVLAEHPGPGASGLDVDHDGPGGGHALREPAPGSAALGGPALGDHALGDMALGVADLVAEGLLRAGQRGLSVGLRGWSVVMSAVTLVTPGFARRRCETTMVDLAERGRRARQERSEAATVALTQAITTAATSEAARDLAVVVVAEASDELLDVMMPSVLDAMATYETQAKLDELIAGLLLRQLPSALEKTLPQVLLRTATRPALGVVPFLGGVTSRL